MSDVKKIELTPEYLELIQSYCAIDIDREITYTPEAYRTLPSELRPKFLVRRLDGTEDIKTLKKYTDISGSQTNLDWGEYAIEVCKLGLKSWSNYYDETGKIIDFSGEYKEIPKLLIYELCNVIVGNTFISQEEETGLK